MTPTEVELKLLLPGAKAKTVEQTLARQPALASLPRRRQWLWNRYFDTPAQDLRRQRSALRLRCVSDRAWPPGATADPPPGAWIQTFKTAGVSQGGLSRRGEWETGVAGAELDRAALAATPWAGFDPDGQLFAQLQPCFDTRCRRTTWLVQQADGSRIEVALDVGEIAAAGLTLPMIELELELQAGDAGALFEFARQIAAEVAVLPCDASKAERGYALALGLAHVPAKARPTRLAPQVAPLEAAQLAMGEMLEQFTRNLAGLAHSDEPELVHQARVAWRRWRSATRLLRPWLRDLPERAPLRPLLDTLGQLRDLDVARTETLPAWLADFSGDDRKRQLQGEAALTALAQAGEQQRAMARARLAEPATGLGLLGLAQWLHALSTRADDASHQKAERDWARARISRLLRRLDRALEACEQDTGTALQQHQARLLAKRARYSVETLHDLLPGKKARRWIKTSSRVQTRIGADRDLLRCVELLRELGQPSGLLDFLRGVAAARRRDG
ncbi:MAG: hypothetical protein RJA36_2232 [Pseudomonadota bacterium]|jgi:inorganic triphosphatase YgiF